MATLEEMRTSARKTDESAKHTRLAEISRRKTVIMAKLAQLGISPEDGWTLTPEDPERQGIFITHPDLPNPAVAVLAGDGSDKLFLVQNTHSWQPETAWQIARTMGATL